MSVPAVAVDRLAFTYAGRDEATLRDVSFTLAAGTWTLVTGRTGSGKSTLLRALAGLIPHHTSGTMQGHVELLGSDTRRATTAALAQTVGLVLQAPDEQICTTTVTAEVAFGLENLAVPSPEIGPRLAEALAGVGLAEQAERATHELSGGQKQRLVLASILAMRPRVLLLDEPLSQLDPRAAAELLVTLDRLREAGLTIVLVEHRLDELLPLVDRLLVFNEGRLAADVTTVDTQALAAAFEPCALQLPEISALAARLNLPPVYRAEQLIESLTPGAGATNRTAADSRIDRSNRRRDPTGPSPLLHAVEVAYRFASEQDALFAEVDFTLHAGQRVALLGPNGSGKSTLLALLARLLQPSAGRIQRDALLTVGLVLQHPDLMLFCPTVREELAFGPRQLGLSNDEIAERVERVAQRLSLTRLLDDPPMALSQGQRLRAAVAATLTLHPRLLLLDEPTTGQDARQIDAVLQTLSAMTTSGSIAGLLFSTHDLRAAARYADRVLVLAEGRLAADCTPDELLADDALLRHARLRRPPLLEVRHALGLRGLSVDELAEEIAR